MEQQAPSTAHLAFLTWAQQNPERLKTATHYGLFEVGYEMGLADTRARLRLMSEALQQVTYYHHDDYEFCTTCERALKTFGLLPRYRE